MFRPKLPRIGCCAQVMPVAVAPLCSYSGPPPLLCSMAPPLNPIQTLPPPPDVVPIEILSYPPLHSIPVGTLLSCTLPTTPTNYLPCDGAAVSRTTYADLFAVFGTYYGDGDYSTTFHVPDLTSEIDPKVHYITNYVPITIVGPTGPYPPGPPGPPGPYPGPLGPLSPLGPYPPLPPQVYPYPVYPAYPTPWQ